MNPTAVYDLVTAPAAEPMTVAEVKDHARIDGSADDAYIGDLITAARERVERNTGRGLITQTWRLTLDDWPAANRDAWWDGQRDGPISVLDAAWVELRKAPIAAVTSVVTKDEDNSPTTWAASNYYLARQPNGYGRLTRKSGAVWPVVTVRAASAIEITFTVGYGTLAASVPSPLRHAIKMLAGHWYDNREPASECASPQLMPMGLGAIMASHRVMR